MRSRFFSEKLPRGKEKTARWLDRAAKLGEYNRPWAGGVAIRGSCCRFVADGRERPRQKRSSRRIHFGVFDDDELVPGFRPGLDPAKQRPDLLEPGRLEMLGGNSRGDLLIRVEAALPQKLSTKAKKAVEDLKSEGL